MFDALEYPPAPWHLKGVSVQAFRIVPVARVRASIPRELHIVPILPGKTLAVLYCARYSMPSTLAYSELIIAPALVRMNRRIGFWISRIFVDNQSSRLGGREIWHLPKGLADFAWNTPHREVSVSTGSQSLCRIAWQRGAMPALPRVRGALPVIARLPAGAQDSPKASGADPESMGGHPETWWRFMAAASCRPALRRAKIEVGPALTDLAFAGARHVVMGKGLRLHVPAPAALRWRAATAFHPQNFTRIPARYILPRRSYREVLP